VDVEPLNDPLCGATTTTPSKGKWKKKRAERKFNKSWQWQWQRQPKTEAMPKSRQKPNQKGGTPAFTSRCAGKGRAEEGRGVQKGGLNQTVNYGGRHCCVSSAFLPPKVRRLTPKTTKNCRLC